MTARIKTKFFQDLEEGLKVKKLTVITTQIEKRNEYLRKQTPVV